MAREIKFVTRLDNSKLRVDSDQAKEIIESASTPVQINNNVVATARQLLDTQRQGAQVAQQAAQIEQQASAEKRAEIDKEIIARKEAAAVTAQTARAEANERSALARQTAAQSLEIERRSTADFVEEQKRKTAAFRAELRQQEAEQRAAQTAQRRATGSSGGAFANIEKAANLFTGGLQAFATVQLVRQIGNVTNELDRLRIEASRSKVSLDILSGSSDVAANRIAAIQQAGNGTITTLNAIQIAVQASALGLANTTTEFENLTTAARAVTLVSPVIKDINGALAEISLAGANQSFRRLDQLGLGVQEVKDKIAELQAADASLSDQQAFSAAVVDTLNTKYGALLKTTEAQASGQEQLATSWDDLKVALADTAPVIAADRAMGDLALRIQGLRAVASGDFSFFGNIDVVQRKIEELSEKIQGATNGFVTEGNIPIPVEFFETQREQLQKIIPLQEQLNALQKTGAVGVDEYQNQLKSLAGQMVANLDSAQSLSPELFKLSENIKAAAELPNGDSQASKALADAQKLLGDEFISTSESAKALILALAQVQAEYNFDGNIKRYNAQVNALRQGFFALKDASEQYRESQEQQKRVELIGDSEKQFVQFAVDQSAQLVEAGGNYDEAIAILEQKKQLIKDFFEKLPADIKPEVIPIYLAQLQVQLEADPLGKAKAVIEQQRQSLLQVVQQQAQALVEEGKSTDEALAYIEAQTTKVNDFIDSLPTELTPEEVTIRSVQYRVDNLGDNPLDKVREELQQQVQDSLTGIVKDGLNPDTALGLINGYNQRIADAVNALPENISPEELQLKLAEISAIFDDELGALAERVQLNVSNIEPDFALDTILDGLGRLNDAGIAATPGLDAVRDSLFSLYDAIASQGYVTEDQVKQLEELTAATLPFSDSIDTISGTVAGLGDDFFDSHSEAGVLLETMAKLEGTFINSGGNAEEFAGKMSALIDRLVEVAKEAGITGDALNKLLDLQSDLKGLSGTAGFAAGRTEGTQDAEIVRLKTAEETSREQERAAERARREWEKAEAAALRAAKKTAQEFENSLGKVKGLFGTSKVTQQQLDLAAAGVPQNFADDFVRRLEDVVVNGKQRNDVSLDDAKKALENIGIDATKLTAEQVLALIKQTWEDSSLFANTENLQLINFDAVNADLELQKKAEQGRQNIVDYLGQVYSVNVNALTGEEPTAGTPGGVAPGAAPNQQAITAQQQAQLSLTIQVDEKAINAAATQYAQLFEKVFMEHDFTAMAAAPANAMLIGIEDAGVSQQFRNAGIRAADLVRDGFAGRVAASDWLTDLRNAFYNDLVSDTTNAVLNALSG